MSSAELLEGIVETNDENVFVSVRLQQWENCISGFVISLMYAILGWTSQVSALGCRRIGLFSSCRELFGIRLFSAMILLSLLSSQFCAT